MSSASPEVTSELDGFPADLEPTWSLGKLYDAYKAVLDLKAGAKKWPFKLGWKIDDLAEMFKLHAAKFELRQQELLNQFGKRLEKKKASAGEVSFILLKPEEYRTALQELATSIPVNFNAEKIKPIAFEELEKVEGLQISSEAIRTLRYLGLVES